MFGKNNYQKKKRLTNNKNKLPLQIIKVKDILDKKNMNMFTNRYVLIGVLTYVNSTKLTKNAGKRNNLDITLLFL